MADGHTTMSFFGNDAINRVNVHTGIQTLAQSAGGVFVLVYLLQAGVPLPLVLLTQAAMSAARFVLRPFVVPLARRIGLRGTLIAGTILEAAIFPILPQVNGPGIWLAIVIVVGAVGSVLYWTSYHAYFAALGDPEHRGGQIGAREALAALINVVAPLAGGWALATLGPLPAFCAVGVIQALAAGPLLGAPRISIPQTASGGLRAAAFASAMMASDGWFGAGYHYIWMIALFVTLGSDFQVYGGALALAGVAGAAAGLVVGRLVDLGHGRRSTLTAYAIGIAVVIARASSLGNPWLAVMANAAGALFVGLQATVMMTPIYNLQQRAPCPLRFSVATEGGWDLGAACACSLAAALTAMGQPLSVSILLALPGAAAAVALLWRAYGEPGRRAA